MNAPARRNRGLVFVFGSLGLGGAERQAVYLAEYLQQRYDVPLCFYGLYADEGSLVGECERLGIPWRALHLHGPSNAVRLSLAARAVAKLLQEDRPAVVLPYANHANVYCGLVWRRSGASTCIWSQHDAGLHRLPLRYERRAVSRTPRFIAVSRVTGRFVVDELGVRPEQLSIIYNGIRLAEPVADRRAWRQRLQAADDALVVVMVANLTQFKDHETLLRAWKTVHTALAEVPKASVLALAGQAYGDRLRELTALARELGVSDSVRFLGFVDDVSGLLEASDIGVHSSPSEGLCCSVLEAMAVGLPVVASDIPGNAEALGPENSDWMSPPGDAGHLARLILTLSENEDLRRRTGATNVLRVKYHFSVERMCEQTTSLFAPALA